jgi:GTPase involved in cell partitioning and DNA repair
MDEKEKAAILKAAGELFAKDSPDLTVLRQWLDHKPSPQLLEAWEYYIQGLCEQLTASQKNALKTDIVGHARQVAQAAGGFLGMGNKIFKSEQDMLDRLEAAFE